MMLAGRWLCGFYKHHKQLKIKHKVIQDSKKAAIPQRAGTPPYSSMSQFPFFISHRANASPMTNETSNTIIFMLVLFLLVP